LQLSKVRVSSEANAAEMLQTRLIIPQNQLNVHRGIEPGPQEISTVRCMETACSRLRLNKFYILAVLNQIRDEWADVIEDDVRNIFSERLIAET
jgi:hypothetical protein